MSDGDKLLALVHQIFDDDDFLLSPESSPTLPLTSTTAPTRAKWKFPSTLQRQQDYFKEQKLARNRGEAYQTCSGRPGVPRQIGPPCASTCRLHCSQRIGESKRCDLFREFWCIADHTSQWEYIAHHMSVAPKGRVTVGQSRRTYTRSYYFMLNGTLELVCKTMFINTLGITGQWIGTVCKKMALKGYVSIDGRGRANAKKKRRRRRMGATKTMPEERGVSRGDEAVIREGELTLGNGELIMDGDELMMGGEKLMFEGEEFIFDTAEENQCNMKIEFLLDGTLKTDLLTD